ncbi:MAG: lysylphosphatidylglycerol synthase domain-containing protein [Gaiellales bacterium]
MAEQFSKDVGRSLVAIAVLLLGAWTWATFSPNSPLFGRVISTGETPSPKVALSFDDGPTPEYTPGVLDQLREAGARATFFCLGRHVRAHPELAKRIVDEGHELASHGDDHSILALAGPKAIARQLRAAETAFKSAAGTTTALFRTPHGFRSPFVVRVARQLGYRVVGWRGSVFDTACPGVDVIVERCTKELEPGAILLLHDGDGSGQGGDRSQTVEAVGGVIAAGRERGLEFVTVSELASELKPARRRLLRGVAIGAVLVAVVFALSRRFSLGVVADVFTQARLGYVVLALLANLGSVAAKSLTWQAALWAVDDEEHGQVRAGLREIVPAIFIGFLLNTILFARLGEVARVSVLRRKLAARGVDLPVSTAVGTLVTEQILSGITLVVVLAGVIVYVPVPRQATNLLAVLSGVVLTIGLVAAGIEVWNRLRRRHGPMEDDDYVERWWHLLGISFTTILQSLRQGQAIFGRPKLLAWALIASTLSWLAQLVGILFTLKAYGIDLGLGAAGVVFLASNLVQLFPITPGNLGVFQGATAPLLVALYPSVDLNTAVTFSIGLQLIEALLGVGVGLVFMSMEGMSLGALRSQLEQEAEVSEA